MKALNAIGWSEYSLPNTGALGRALIETVPHKPLLSPKRDDIFTSDLLLKVTWSPLISP